MHKLIRERRKLVNEMRADGTRGAKGPPSISVGQGRWNLGCNKPLQILATIEAKPSLSNDHAGPYLQPHYGVFCFTTKSLDFPPVLESVEEHEI